MSCQLFIRPSLAVNERVEWLYQQAGEEPIRGELAAMSQLNALQSRAVGAEVILLAPGESVICLPVNFPLSGKVRLNKAMLKALPYHIEDQIIGPVEDLHWTVLSAAAPCYLAGVSQQQLAQWQTFFTDSALPLHRIVPDFFCLPVAADKGWSALCDGERWIIRQHEYGGLALKANWLRQAIGEQTIEVEAYGALDESALPPHWQRKLSGDPLTILARYAPHRQSNLLAQPLPGGNNKTLPWWRILSGCAVIALIMLCAGLWLSGRQYWQQAARLEAENSRLYQALTHTQKKGGNLRFHLMRRLKSAAQEDKRPDFRQLMLQVAEARAQHPQVTIGQLRYSATQGKLSLTWEGVGGESFAAILRARPVESGLVGEGAANSIELQVGD